MPLPLNLRQGLSHFAACLLLFAATPARAHAQGCILARSPEQTGLPTGQGGVLAPGHVQVTLGERHQYSYQHYVGDVYQAYREQAGTQVENRINLLAANITYQVTPRISVELDMPWLFASRKSHNSPIEYQSSGIGDMVIGVNTWILSPENAHRWNASLGLGLSVPSGNDNVQNTVNTNTTGTGAATTVTGPVDYSIQPGTGGRGAMLEWMGYTRLARNLTFYADGDYIAMNGGTNGVKRSASPNAAQPLNYYVSIADQYLLEAGVSFPVEHVRGLYVTAGPRWEGVPAHNLLPVSNDGFRRPGYAVSLGPGFEYVYRNTILNLGIYKAIHRDRTVSYPDSIYNTHGDAAFAQYVWLASVSHRF